MATTVGSRDLSEEFPGELEVTIEGLGSETINSPPGFDLAKAVGIASATLTGRPTIIEESQETQWEVVFFDRENRKLTVKEIV